MTAVIFDARWLGDHGIGRFAHQVYRSFPDLTPFNVKRRPFHPFDPWLLGSALRGLHAERYFSPGYNSPAAWNGHFVFTLHDLNHLKVTDNSNALKRAYYQYVIKPACHRADFVLTISEYARNEILDWSKAGTDRIVNVGNGVGLPFCSEGARFQPGFPYFVYVGSQKANKNLPRLLEAYAQSGAKGEIRLVMTGAPEAPLSLEIQRLGLSQDVVFVGSRTTEELAELYRGALALMFPSLYEGFGMPPLEAMACGTPVLTSNVCAIPETVGDAALLIDPRSTEQIADGIRRLANDSALRANLREKGLLRAAESSWEKTAVRIKEILQAMGK
ncbi:MAG TPA: glycosyltransferase family 1 protein [Candidatus Sulfotelmatobacter sp.]